jgi:hypothetical protein
MGQQPGFGDAVGGELAEGVDQRGAERSHPVVGLVEGEAHHVGEAILGEQHLHGHGHGEIAPGYPPT